MRIPAMLRKNQGLLIDSVETAVGFPGEETAAPASGSLFLTLRVRNPCPLALRRVSQNQSTGWKRKYISLHKNKDFAYSH